MLINYCRSFAILGLSLLLSGCLVSAQGNLGRIIHPTHPEASKPGPPPHAKAYGHRAKHSYSYYPDASVYFDAGRSAYFFIDSGGSWKMSVSLPLSLKARLGANVTIEMETDRPYTKHKEHKKKYPGGKSKKNKKQKKNKKWD